MITEKYCNEILQQYPEYITKDQMYRICHIGKKTCLFLLESGLVPNIDSGKKTRRFKIKTVDVIQYLKDRDDYPELFKAPDGFYKGKGGDKKAPSFALYETGVTAEYGDRLITLSTCEYSAQNGRLVVVAKKTA